VINIRFFWGVLNKAEHIVTAIFHEVKHIKQTTNTAPHEDFHVVFSFTDTTPCPATLLPTTSKVPEMCVWQAVRTRYHRTVAVTEATSPHTHTHTHTHEPNLHCDSFSEDKEASNQYQHNDVGFCPFQTQRPFVKHIEGSTAAFICTFYTYTLTDNLLTN